MAALVDEISHVPLHAVCSIALVLFSTDALLSAAGQTQA
jgi:hypothetical protein